MITIDEWFGYVSATVFALIVGILVVAYFLKVFGYFDK